MSTYEIFWTHALHNGLYSCVGMCNLSKSTFFICLGTYEISILGQSRSSMSSTFFSKKWQESRIFSVSFAKHSIFAAVDKKNWILTKIQTSTVPNQPVQLSRTPESLLRGFVFFCKTEWEAPNKPITQNSNILFDFLISQLNIQYNAKHTTSKVDSIEHGIEKDFYVKAKESFSHAKKQTWVWSACNYLTVTSSFAIMWLHCTKGVL